MDKSNANSEKILDNNNGNIKTIKNIPQIKILDLSTILHLHHCSEFIIRFIYYYYLLLISKIENLKKWTIRYQ